MSSETTACPSGDAKVELFGLLLETNARMSRSLGLELEAECELPLAWIFEHPTVALFAQHIRLNLSGLQQSGPSLVAEQNQSVHG